MIENTIGDDISADLQETYHQYKRTAIIKKLAAKTDLNFDQISKLVVNPEHGEIIKTITLKDIIDAQSSEEDDDEEEAEPSKPAKAAKKTAAPPAKGKKAAKASPAKKAAKKTAASAAPKAKKTASGEKKPKADKGKKKPRLDYEKGCKEVLAALKTAGEPIARGAIEEATGFSGVQVRTFCKKLAEQGKIEVLGSGGRSTRYKLA